MLHQKFKKPQSMKSPKPAFLRRIAAVLALAVLGVALVFAVPDMRAIAQSIIETLFPVAETDEFVLQRNDVVYFDDPQIFNTVDEMEATSDIDVIDLSFLPETYSIERVIYVDEVRMAIVVYALQYANFDAIQPDSGLDFRQQRLADADALGTFGDPSPLAAIGPTAEVQTIQIGDFQAEWVQGSWSINEGENEFNWVNDVPVYRIRWQDETYIYQIRFWFNTEPRSAEDFIQNMAEAVAASIATEAE